MPQNEFIFKHFIIKHDKSAMKVGTDAMILGAWVPVEGATQILDIGTGTGVLSLMLAQRSGAEIDAVEIDEGAFLQANENFKNSIWGNRIHAFHTSIQGFAPLANRKYDLIISNPPYFEHNLKAAETHGKYRDRSHARSFDALSFADLLIHTDRLLSDTGRFYVIIPFEAKTPFISEADKNGLLLFDSLDILSKETQIPVRAVLGFGRENRSVRESRLVIYKDTGAYTDLYIELTKNYHAKDMAKR